MTVDRRSLAKRNQHLSDENGRLRDELDERDALIAELEARLNAMRNEARERELSDG